MNYFDKLMNLWNQYFNKEISKEELFEQRSKLREETNEINR